MANLYNSTKWYRIRDRQRKANPICSKCGKPGNIVDHIVPHKGNVILFYDMKNLQTLCVTCHNSWKRKIEINGKEHGCNRDGIPLDINHHWNKRK